MRIHSPDSWNAVECLTHESVPLAGRRRWATSSPLEPQANSGQAELDQYRMLLKVVDVMVRHQDVPKLLAGMAERLGEVAAAEFTNFSLHDPTRNVMRMHVLEGKNLVHVPIEVPVA